MLQLISTIFVVSLIAVGFLYEVGAFTPATYDEVCLTVGAQAACTPIPTSVDWRLP